MDLRTIQGGGGGVLGACARAGLRVLSLGWALGAWIGRVPYALGLRRPVRLDVPVISVGNIAVGGTGKTPFVAWLAARLRANGRTPGILARGYGGPLAEQALNDEGLVLRYVLGEDVPQQQDPDRVRGGRALLARHPEVDVILLDDGFQHRRLARDLDIVLLDAMEPFGFGHLLPRGRLRERPAALGRAGATVLTRTERVPAPTADVAAARIERLAGRPPARARTVLAARGLRDELDGATVFAVCGIGNPRGFLGTLDDLGARVVGRRVLRDHEVMPESSWADIVGEARETGAECIVTTRKDAVKYDSLPAEVVVIDVETEIVAGEDELWAAVLGVLG
ncbi:MAG: tetraacyldisaccharide 4'-kinase [Planctomycetota bacterium]|nr:tetraacyldisaccharide 4'-kinase [Planctomycetota bacterium]